MTLLDIPYHPLCLLSIQILILVVTLGFTRARCAIRPILLPLMLALAYFIIVYGNQYIRLIWATLLSGFANGFVLQYIDLVLLRTWSAETEGSTILGIEQSDKDKQGSCSLTTTQRLMFGLFGAFSYRKINTPFEVRNVPRFIPANRGHFVIQKALHAIGCMLIIDILSLLPPPPNPGLLFSPSRVAFISRLSEVTHEDLLMRIGSTAIYWGSMYAILQGLYSCAAAIAVGLGFSTAREWNPLFGLVSAASTLRGFWGTFWHQSLRDPLYRPASFLSDRVLKMNGLLTARYTKLFTAFLISGIMHVSAEHTGNFSCTESGTLRFFLTQAAGIASEDAIRALLSRCKRTDKKRTFLNSLPLGHAWVAIFLIWSTPAWLYPIAAMGQQESFLPFSITKTAVEVAKRIVYLASYIPLGSLSARSLSYLGLGSLSIASV